MFVVDDGERWQAYDEQGRPTVAISKPQAAEGVLHGSAHVWIWRIGDGGIIEVLLQLRALGKPTWPGYLDISAAGHIDYGESALDAAKRETKEEIGLELDEDKLRLLFVHRQYTITEPNKLIENEFQWVYTYHMTGNAEFTHSDGEVSDQRWVSLDEFKHLIDSSDKDKLVPQGSAYFAELLRGIERHSGENH